MQKPQRTPRKQSASEGPTVNPTPTPPDTAPDPAALEKLTTKQRRFVEEYMTDHNGTQAAIRAGYSPKTARAIAHENLTKPYIQEAIQMLINRLSERSITEADQVVAQLTRIAFFDVGQYVRHLPIDGPEDLVHGPSGENPPSQRCRELIEGVRTATRGWGADDSGGSQSTVVPVVTAPGHTSALKTMHDAWPIKRRPHTAAVASPFFDPPSGGPNAPATALWKLLRPRGQVQIQYHLTAEEVPGEDALLLNAPESLQRTKPEGRPGGAKPFLPFTCAT